MVESTALEMRRAGNRTVGSNPTLSASSPTHRAIISDRLGAAQHAVRTIHSLDSALVPIRDAEGPLFCPVANTFRGPVESLINVAIKQVLSILTIFVA